MNYFLVYWVKLSLVDYLCCLLVEWTSYKKIKIKNIWKSHRTKHLQNGRKNWSVKMWPYTAQKMKFSIKDFLNKCDQIHRALRIWSHLLKKSLMQWEIYWHYLLTLNNFFKAFWENVIYMFCYITALKNFSKFPRKHHH